MKNIFDIFPRQKFQQLNTQPTKLVSCSFLYFFCLLCSYFILRPLRDEMGIVNGAMNMQWLFTGTFVAMLCIVPIFALLMAKTSIKRVLILSYSFFVSNIFIFYILFETVGITKPVAIAFFIWLSVFNLFVVSLFWSFMADVFTGPTSKRFFGIIAGGGSLGALTGPLIANYLSKHSLISTLLLVAALFLFLALCCIFIILALSRSDYSSKITTAKTLSIIKLFAGIRNIAKSRYLISIVIFILLYTTISTVLYFEQAHIVEDTLGQQGQRISYFSNIDFTVNTIAIIGQLLLTGSIIQRFGLAKVLASIPFLMGLGLLFLGTSSSLWVIAALMVIHRSGNFILLRPSREILYTVTSLEEKYKAKNFIDTAIYRGGDALVGWLFAGLVAIGWGLGAIAFLAIPLAFIWSFVGHSLGKQQFKKEKNLTLNNKIHENNI
ncbi:NTP/NDP exchange transporter [Flagellimonas sp. S3867]|uniref:NTP/NDP exchange transporter n=1 Tax=Flagellimonas sp. S3867 TaxID=2768063 RepID=UPI001684654F|nr:MFS transporter [Flagellimonas sp. S3867]